MTLRVLITGGAGFIGAHLARRLLAEGARIDLVDDFSRGQRDPDFAEAYALKGATGSMLYWFFFDRSDSIVAACVKIPCCQLNDCSTGTHVSESRPPYMTPPTSTPSGFSRFSSQLARFFRRMV